MDKLSQEMLRKAVHLSSLWMVVAIYFLPKHAVVLIFGSLSLLTFVVEWLRRNNDFAKKIFMMLFGRMLRESEIDKEVTGAVYFVFAALVVCVVFPKGIAIIALSVMIIADTAAALIGKKFGKTVLIGDKTLEGAQAFFISAVITIICLKQLLLHIDF
jgi:dolichol kinase